MSKLDFAVSQLNVPYGGNLLRSEHLEHALLYGSALKNGIPPSSAALIYSAFSELQPSIIAECIYEIGGELEIANNLYIESIRQLGVRSEIWEKAIDHLI